jgi:hypothetical protein
VRQKEFWNATHADIMRLLQSGAGWQITGKSPTAYEVRPEAYCVIIQA